MGFDSLDTVIMLAPAVVAAIMSFIEVTGLNHGWPWMFKLGIPYGRQRETVPFEIAESAEIPDISDLDLRMVWVTPNLLGYRYLGSGLRFRASGGGIGARGAMWIVTGLLEVRREGAGTTFVGRNLIRYSPLLFVLGGVWMCLYFGLRFAPATELHYCFIPVAPILVVYLGLAWWFSRRLGSAYHLITAELVVKAREALDEARGTSS